VTALSVAGDRFVTALIWGGPFLAGGVLVAIVCLWVAGLVELANTDVTYTPAPDTQVDAETRDAA
jgi:hypothetical protein